MMRWTKVTAAFSETPEDWALPIEVFRCHGCEGTEQTDFPATLSGYVPMVPGWQARVNVLTAALGEGADDVYTAVVDEEDWAENWKAHFPPLRIGRRWVVRPTWETVELGPDDLELVLDPGQAFGTGDHATTSMCLELLEDADVAGKSVLDIGCGSGILSIGAAKLGADRVLAVDIEPGAVEVARVNAERNGVVLECVEQDALGEGADTGWDVILSNIISATLIRIAVGVRAHIADGGLWIVSGVIRSNWDDVLAAATRAGFGLEQQLVEGEWVAARFRAPGGEAHGVR